MTIGLPTSLSVGDHAGHSVADDGFSLMLGLAVGHQWHAERIDVVAAEASVSTTARWSALRSTPMAPRPWSVTIGHVHHRWWWQTPASLSAVPLEPVADGRPQFWWHVPLSHHVLTPVACILSIAVQAPPAPAHARRRTARPSMVKYFPCCAARQSGIRKSATSACRRRPRLATHS